MGKSVAFFENGSWHHRTKVLQEDYSVKYGKKGGFNTKEEAEESYRQYEEEFERKSSGVIIKFDDSLTFRGYLIYWFENVYSTRIEITTRMVGAYAVFKLILPSIIEDIKMKFVTAEYLNDILKRIDTTFKGVSAEKSREIFSGMLKDALTNNIILYNPIKNVDYYERNSKKVTILNKSQLKRFLEIVSDSNWYLEILLGLFCGLRRGEIQGTKFDDFSDEESTITISRQLVPCYELEDDMELRGFKIKDYSIEERDPKTRNSLRKLRVPKIIMAQVKNRKKLKEYYQEKNANFKDFGYIGFQPNGHPHGVNSLNKYLKEVCQKNGLPHITVHSLRHMFATILAEQGVPLTKISAMLGHESIHTTFEFYCEIMEDIENINAFMNNEFSMEEMRERKCS